MSAITKFKFEPDEQMEALRRLVGKDLTASELELFAKVCANTGLDPFLKQIYTVKRNVKNKDGSFTKVMNIQTSIDGFRAISERTGCYSPGREPTYTYNDKNELVSATAYIKKMTPDGTWHEVAATAFWDEYCPKEGYGKFWEQMPHVMLAKCAETAAHRKAFPSQTAKLLSKEEMFQAKEKEDDEEVKTIQSEDVLEQPKLTLKSISSSQLSIILRAIGSDAELKSKICDYVGVQDLSQMPETAFDKVMDRLNRRVS